MEIFRLVSIVVPQKPFQLFTRQNKECNFGPTGVQKLGQISEENEQNKRVRGKKKPNWHVGDIYQSYSLLWKGAIEIYM